MAMPNMAITYQRHSQSAFPAVFCDNIVHVCSAFYDPQDSWDQHNSKLATKTDM